MIERYTLPKMKAVWTLENKFVRWLEVELAICEGWVELGVVPRESLEKIRALAKFDVERILWIEQNETQHDLMAFVKNVTEPMGEDGRFFHFGVTSYDVEDTATGLLLGEASDIILEGIARLSEVIRTRAREHKKTMMIGRTHGIHAEPITFGFKLAGWLYEMQRNRERLEFAREMVAYGKVSGAVGTYANVDPRIQDYVCRKLGLKSAPVSTQILQRDRHAQFITTLAILSSSMERFATEVRNLQRTEIREVQEYFAAGQRGSSAMPHKRNPWRSEQVSGLARVVRSYAVAALENIVTWHERDLSNSSVERVIFPDACAVVDYQLHTFARILERLVVQPDQMQTNLEKMGDLTSSEQVMLALIYKGLTREEAYKVAQRNAARAWEGEDFQSCVRSDPETQRFLTPEEIDHIFDRQHHLKNLDVVFERLGI
ncbi:MAG: adenylosuccinate lyase [Armatimonadetes bacterium]|nr:adenylosuccinate lyase [Armatimonadota bacterium]